MRIIGDIHSHPERYQPIIADCPASIQLGDMGFSGMYNYLNDNVDPSKHRFIPGNHDNYAALPAHSFCGDYGFTTHHDLEFFYIRGALSVDKSCRIPYVSWWPQEEIEIGASYMLFDLVQEIKPDIILSHDCPFECYRNGVLTNNAKLDPSFTTQLLSAVFNIHKPKLWIFGHHHNSWRMEIEGTQFICLNTNDYLDLET